MSTERPKGIPIAVGRRIVKDDQKPQIDAYGLAMIESLCGRLQTLHFTEDDEGLREKLEQVMEYAESIVDRYS
ncbi:hypothetical protein FQZ97_1010230 [compost metagenome]